MHSSYSSNIAQHANVNVGSLGNRYSYRKEIPLSYFANYSQAVPEFLEAWPYLRSMNDVDAYARAAKHADMSPLAKSGLTEERVKTREFDSFFIKLRQELGQPIARRS